MNVNALVGELLAIQRAGLGELEVRFGEATMAKVQAAAVVPPEDPDLGPGFVVLHPSLEVMERTKRRRARA